MRIATKLTLLLIAAVVAVMVAFGALCAQQERQHLISELQQETWLPANAITLTVEDSGAGMTTEELERNFEPCYSTKGRGLGTGLGMSIIQDIVQAHRGSICGHSAKGAGTTVRLSWSIADSGPKVTQSGEVTPHGIPDGTDAGPAKPRGPTSMSLAIRAARNSG